MERADSISVKALRRDGKERTFSRFKKGARDSLGSSGLEPASDHNEALEKIRKLLAHLESGKASDGFAVTGYSRALDDLNKLRDEAINGDADVDTKILVRDHSSAGLTAQNSLMVSTASLAIIHVLKAEVKSAEGDMSADLCMKLSNLLRDVRRSPAARLIVQGVQGWRRRKYDNSCWDDSLCKVRGCGWSH